jgi:hypothetical protein
MCQVTYKLLLNKFVAQSTGAELIVKNLGQRATPTKQTHLRPPMILQEQYL